MRKEEAPPAHGCGTQILAVVCVVLLIALLMKVLDGLPHDREILRWTSIWLGPLVGSMMVSRKRIAATDDEIAITDWRGRCDIVAWSEILRVRPNAFGICIAVVNEHGCTEKFLLAPADLKRSGCADRVLVALEKRFALGPPPKWRWAATRASVYVILPVMLCVACILAEICFGEVALPVILGLAFLGVLGAILWQSYQGTSPDERARRLRKAGWVFPRDGAAAPRQGEPDSGSAEEVTH